MKQVVTGYLAPSQWGRMALRLSVCFIAVAVCSQMALAQLSAHFEQVRQRPTKPIQAGDHERVALP